MPRVLNFITAGSLLLAGVSMYPSLLLKLREGIPGRLIALVFILAFAVRLLFRREIRFNKPVITILWLQITTLLFLELYHGSSDSGTGYIISAVTLIVVLIAYLVLENYMNVLESFIHAYVLLMVIILTLVFFSVVLAYAGMVEPYPIYDRGTSSGSTIYSIGLTLSNEVLKIGDGYLVRASGLFDEPGQLGIYVTLAILANAVVLNNKRYELLLIILGLFTASLGLFVSMFLFLMFWRRKIWFVVCLIFLVAGAVGVFANLQGEDSLLYSHTIDRILLLVGSEFGGNRGASSIAGAAMLWNVGPWGLSETELLTYDLGLIPATFFGPFLTYGLIGGGILYMHILLIGASGIIQELGHIKRLFSNNSFRVFIVMGATLYHRPSCLNFLYYLLLLAIYVKEKREHVHLGNEIRSF